MPAEEETERQAINRHLHRMHGGAYLRGENLIRLAEHEDIHRTLGLDEPWPEGRGIRHTHDDFHRPTDYTLR